MAEHKHGSMDTTEQEKTFAGFAKFTTNTVIGAVYRIRKEVGDE